MRERSAADGPRRLARVEDRWPVALAPWTPTPDVLWRRATKLGLSDGELRLVLALEVEREPPNPSVVVSQADLAALCGCTDRSLRRRVERLRERGYLTTRRASSEGGQWPATRYDLGGLWAALADAADRRTPASAGHKRPQDTSAGVRRTPASGRRRTPASALSREGQEKKTERETPPRKTGQRLTYSRRGGGGQ